MDVDDGVVVSAGECDASFVLFFLFSSLVFTLTGVDSVDSIFDLEMQLIHRRPFFFSWVFEKCSLESF